MYTAMLHVTWLAIFLCTALCSCSSNGKILLSPSIVSASQRQNISLPCGSSCSAGKPISEGNGVWQVRDASCECINDAIERSWSGNTIKVPPGSVDWGNSYLSITKAVKLFGAGSNKTIIRSSAKNTFHINSGIGGQFSLRISGFKFLKNIGSTCIQIDGAGDGWRIDNNVFEADSPAHNGVATFSKGSTSTLYGLIDGNTFKYTRIDIGGTSVSASESWLRAAQWEMPQRASSVFIENNVFIMGDICDKMLHNSIDSNNGARAVIRYNIFNDAYIMAHSACEVSVRGTRSYEIYNNVFRRTCPDFGSFVFLRAGSHIIANNFVTGTWNTNDALGKVTLDNRRSWFDSFATHNNQCKDLNNPSACCTGRKKGHCSGRQNGFADCNGISSADTNIKNTKHNGLVDGYLCLDQPGAGTGKIGKQTSDPIYIWNNKAGYNCIGGSNKYGTCMADGDCPGGKCSTYKLAPNKVHLHNNRGHQPYHIVANRDFYENKLRPNWTPYTCPHPLAELKGICTDTPGTDGYNKL